MKTKVLNLAIIFFVVLLSSNKLKSQQLTLTCESGNRAIEQANCWAFGATTYINTSGLVISGSFSTQSNQLTNPLPTASWVKTPWMKIGSGNITLKAKLSVANGTTRGVVFSYIPYNPLNPPSFEGIPVPYDSLKWSAINTNLVNVSSKIPQFIENSNDVYKIRISFVGTGGNSRMIADDYSIHGTYWSDPSNNCMPLPTIQDIDGDGVADNDDAFPNDPKRAFRTFSPVQNTFSTLAFEDLWPSKGDFDFNDVVVDYNTEIVTNANNMVVEAFYKFKVRAIGASYHNGFGFELLNIPPSFVKSVTGTVVKPGSIYSIDANGTENNQDNATIIAIGDVFDVLPYVGVGVTGVNTTPGAPYSIPQTITVRVVFDDDLKVVGGVHISQMGSNVFNPFIIVNQDRGKEVHLPDYPPTSLANTSLFGTLDDTSNPNTERYYRTTNNLPWAINTYSTFKYPIEKTEITKAYLRLIDWVLSNKSQFNDWDTNPTFIDNTHIYNTPTK